MSPDTAHDAKGGPSAERKLPPEIADERLDPDAVKVVRRLRRAGFSAYLVGGCVRDLLLGMRPKDFDVATSAHPNQVKETFRNSRLIGRRFRLAHIYFRGGKIIEVSTFRKSPLDELADLPQDLLIRHDNVFGSAEEDARRRDFSINGLFYDVDEGKVVDHVGGKADLSQRLVRTIGNPDVRMREDPVRILRAIRFAAKCNLRIEPETFAAMKQHVAEIPRCAPPRVLEEMLKLLRNGASRRCLELLRDVGALRVLLPPVAEHLESRGAEEAARHLRALDALDAHVRMGEIPSDAVLLATLLAPLPRGKGPRGPIPAPGRRPEPAQPAPTAGESVAEAPEPPEESDELDEELSELSRELDEGNGDPAHAPLPEGALREEETHDDRLEPTVPSTLSVAGAQPEPWSLPKGAVAPEIVLAEMVRTARLPRRIAERARLVLAAQPLLSGERKKRRFSPQAFVRQSIFPEALAVFELSVAATGRGADQLQKWQALFAGQDFSQLEPEERRRTGASRSASAPPRRRRRRGGRSRRPPSKPRS
ncbi:MAG TPA: polynucleotide adenylyltransferase PcnB [Myxococcales bacterium]|nr:polynucleotide adenylyltransferase PcnB [Myxococcales bacterium]